MTEEPTSEAAVAAYVERELLARDPFVDVALASDEHRAQHLCDVYPSRPGHMLGALAASTGARRILEIGGGVGYSALWLAHGAGAGATVQTIEADPGHAETMTSFAAKHGHADTISVLAGTDEEVLPRLVGLYDLVFYDAAIPGPGLVDHLERLVRLRGLVIASNIFLGRYVPDHPDLSRGAAFRQRMLESQDWLASFANGKLLAVRAL
jgi:predicted O-methyltransferase YrrM